MITMPRPGNEDASTGKSIGAVYDIWNRQVRTFDDSDSDGVQDAGEELIAEYRYDGLNRRIRKFLPRYTGGPGEPRILADWTVRDDYYNQNWQLLETRKADGVARSSLGGGKYAEPAAATAVYCQYIWSPHYIDAPVLRDRNADGDPSTTQLGLDNMGLEERTLYSYDANYNVTALWQDGANGGLLGSLRAVQLRSLRPGDGAARGQGYDPEVDGVNIFEWQPKSANPDGSSCVSRYDNEILFCGYRFDWETGFYNVRHRIYHPTLGRWTRWDPAGYVDGGNRFEYVSSNPIVLVDPQGLACCAYVWSDDAFGIPGISRIGGAHTAIELNRDGQSTLIKLGAFNDSRHASGNMVGYGPLGPTMYIYYALIAQSWGLTNRNDLAKMNALSQKHLGHPAAIRIDLLDEIGTKIIGAGPKRFYGLYISPNVSGRGKKIKLELPVSQECKALDKMVQAAKDIGAASMNDAMMTIIFPSIKIKLFGYPTTLDITGSLWVGYGYDGFNRNCNSFTGSVLRKAGLTVPNELASKWGIQNDFTKWQQWDLDFQKLFQDAADRFQK